MSTPQRVASVVVLGILASLARAQDTISLFLPDGRTLAVARISTNTPVQAIKQSLQAEGVTVIALNPELTLTAAIPLQRLAEVSKATSLLFTPALKRPITQTAAAAARAEPGLGDRPPTPEEAIDNGRRFQPVVQLAAETLSFMRAALEGVESLPSFADNSLSKYFPPIEDQGGQGSCTAWASCYYYNTFTQAKDGDINVSGGNTDFVNSPAFMYPLVNRGVDNGANTQYVVGRLSDVGCCNLTLKPYSESDFTSWPIEQAWINALHRRTARSHLIGSNNGCTEDDLTAIKQHLANGNLLVTRTEVYSNWHPTFRDNQSRGIENGVLFSHAGQTYKGSHAMTIVGYDDNRLFADGASTNQGAFLICNSWGDSWGTFNSSGTSNRGFMWVAYDYFRADNDCFAIAFFNDDRNDYRPQLYAVSGINHAQRGRASFGGGVGTTQAQSWSSYSPISYAGGLTLSVEDSRRLAVDLTQGMPFISDYSSIVLFSRLTVSGSASADGSMSSTEFFHDFDRDGSYETVFSTDPTITVNAGSSGFAGVTFSAQANRAPVLSNPRVSPVSGKPGTTFEYLIDYLDIDGDAPDLSYRTVYISSAGATRTETMTLKSGTAANGTYRYATTLNSGVYSFCFLFADGHGATDVEGWHSGPTVCSEGETPINIFIQSSRISTDLRLKYSLTGASGPWTDLPVTKQRLDPIVVSPGDRVWFEASVASPNFEYREWEGYENGVRFGGSTSSAWNFSLGLSTTSVGLNVFYDYTPQTYTITGTAKHGDGSLVPGGVSLLLESLEQTVSKLAADGNFSFSGVVGGVSVAITPSASGHQFSPARLVYENLQEDRAEQHFTAYVNDDTAPIARLLSVPPAVADEPNVLFSWSGSDDLTAARSLMYRCRLEGFDADWSGWSTNTSFDYVLPNGVYTFRVEAKDEAGNENQAPVKHAFAVNAAPQIVLVERTTRSVWSSRVTLHTPISAVYPTNIFVLLPGGSAILDDELVPVSLHREDEIAPCGANEIVAVSLAVPASIAASGPAWLVTLPDDIALGETSRYEVVWGKIGYFGWKKFETIPLNFPNGAKYYPSAFLDDQLRLWRMASKSKVRDTTLNLYDSWMFREVSSVDGCHRAEEIVKFVPADVTVYDDGGTPRYYGTLCEMYGMQRGFISADNTIWSFWPEVHHVRTQEQQDGDTQAYGCNRFHAAFLEPLDSGTESLRLTNSIPWTFPALAEDGRVWLVASRTGPAGNGASVVASIVNTDGSVAVQSMVVASVPAGARSRGVNVGQPCNAGGKMWFVYHKWWKLDRSGGPRRSAVYAKGFNPDGSIYADEFLVSPAPSPDADDLSEKCKLRTDNIIADQSGKVWVGFRKNVEPAAAPAEDRYYYSIISTNGTLWKGPIETAGDRTFHHCDRDGIIWASEASTLMLLTGDDTQADSDRPLAYFPNQRVQAIEAAVQTDGYRLFDRWSPQTFVVDVPARCVPALMQLFDLDMWDNGLHPANLRLQQSTNNIWRQGGVFAGNVSIAVTGVLQEGHNALTMAQDDLLGGQVLMTFPYVLQHRISAAAGANGRVEPQGMVTVSNGANQVFAITPDVYFHVTDVIFDDHSAGPKTSHTFANVTSDHSLLATFAPDMATNNTPVWWLAEKGLTNSAWDVEAMGDQDHDGMLTWEEYQADTHPGNSGSVLRLLSFAVSNEEVVVEWQGGQAVRQFVESRTSLAGTGTQWQCVFTNNPITAVTNSVICPAASNAFYRIKAGR